MEGAHRICDLQDNQDMSTVEKPGFKKMLKTFDARYKPPGRKYFSETAIPGLYSSNNRFVLRPYLSYTVHYIDSTWTLTL